MADYVVICDTCSYRSSHQTQQQATADATQHTTANPTHSVKRRRLIPRIAELQSEATAVLAERDAQAVHERLRSFLTHYDVFNYMFLYGAPLWRARICRDRSGFSNIADVHYPSPSKTPVGRLNESGSPLLYVCFNTFTALHEKKAKTGDFVQLISYSMQRSMHSLLLGEYTNVHRRGQGVVPGDVSEKLNKILSKMAFHPGLSFVFMDAFLSGIFSDPNASQRNYLHSRMLSRLLFEKYPGIEAIHYPSVALEASMNLAIRPVVADEALRITKTSVVYIKKQYDYGLYDFTVERLAQGVSPDGEIEWA